MTERNTFSWTESVALLFRARAKRGLGDSAQAMTEACIGIALLTFSFVLIAFITHMSVMRIRTAMAARHAAWLEGNDRVRNDYRFLNNENIDNWFFFPSENAHLSPLVETTRDRGIDPNSTLNTDPSRRVKVETAAGKSGKLSMSGGILGGISAIAINIVSAFVGQEARTVPAMRVSYGIDSISGSDAFPFILLHARIPFMPESAIEGSFYYGTECQWEPVSNPWLDAALPLF